MLCQCCVNVMILLCYSYSIVVFVVSCRKKSLSFEILVSDIVTLQVLRNERWREEGKEKWD